MRRALPTRIVDAQKNLGCQNLKSSRTVRVPFIKATTQLHSQPLQVSSRNCLRLEMLSARQQPRHLKAKSTLELPQNYGKIMFSNAKT